MASHGQAVTFGNTVDSAFSAVAVASSAPEMTPANAIDFRMYCRRLAAAPGYATGSRRLGFCTSPTRTATCAVVSADAGHP